MSTDRIPGDLSSYDVCYWLSKIRDAIDDLPKRRDFFAAAALSVISWGDADFTAARAFEIADAMMKARHE